MREKKIIYSNYNIDTKVSTVTISTEIGNFTAKAKLNKEDIAFGSSFFGCEIAEMRAIVKYLKAKRKNKMIRKEELFNMWLLFCSSSHCPPSSREARIINNRIDDYTLEIRKIDNDIKLLKENIKHKIDVRYEYYYNKKGE